MLHFAILIILMILRPIDVPGTNTNWQRARTLVKLAKSVTV